MESPKKPDTSVEIIAERDSVVIPSQMIIPPDVFGEFTVAVNGVVIARDKNKIDFNRLYQIDIDCLIYRSTPESDNYLRQLRDSIAAHGQMMEITVTQRNLVLDGNLRVQAMKALGFRSIAGRILNLTYEQFEENSLLMSPRTSYVPS